jgi:hypothetical protein
MTAESPWMDLPPSAPYVHPPDREIVDGVRARAFGADHRLRLELLPEPYLGDPGARVVLLSRNPGFHPNDVPAHGRADFAAACRGNLAHQPSAHPFYLLDPAFQATPGGQYWRQKLRYVAERVRRALGAKELEAAWQAVAQGVLCVEYHGYHSPLYRSLGATLPTQRYGFALVAAAVRRGAVILALRSVRDWMEAVPELRGYARLFRTRSPQNVTVTPRNCPEGWSSVIEGILAQKGNVVVWGEEDRPVAGAPVGRSESSEGEEDDAFRDPQTTVELLDLLEERFGFADEEFQLLHHFGPDARVASHRRYCEVDAPRFQANRNNVIVARRLASVRELREAGLGWEDALATARSRHPFPPKKSGEEWANAW